MAVTIKDIAREVGVSYETVSRALNRRGRVNPDTADRIREVAKRLNYTPNALARGLRVKNTMTLGVVFPCIYENEFYAGIYRGLEDALLAREYSIFLANSNFDMEREARNILSLNSRRVDGIVLGPCIGGDGDYANAAYIQSVIDGGTPVLMVDREVAGVQTDIVASDHREGGRLATEHLLELGHRRIACIIGPTVSSTRERFAGYTQAFTDRGLTAPADLVRWSEDLLAGGGEDLAHELLGLPPDQRPTAIFAVNDIVASNCVTAAVSRGLQVPEDISIAGYDDLKAASQLPLGITSVRQDLDAIGAALGQLFLARVDETPPPDAPAYPANQRLPNILIPRASTGPVRHAQ